jgi:hypothetical protein
MLRFVAVPTRENTLRKREHFSYKEETLFPTGGSNSHCNKRKHSPEQNIISVACKSWIPHAMRSKTQLLTNEPNANGRKLLDSGVEQTFIFPDFFYFAWCSYYLFAYCEKGVDKISALN